jgi:putative transposase
MLVHQAYQFALDPTPQQQGALASHCGAARYAFNWALKLVQRRLDERGAGLDVEVPWRLPALRREWNRAKQRVAPWWWENSKEAYNSGLDALARACRTGRTPRRAGGRVPASASPSARRNTAPGRPAGSPLARSVWNPTGIM